MVMTDSSTVTRTTVRIILSVDAGKNLSIFTGDLSQAYVSTDTPLLRKFFFPLQKS